MGNQNSGRRPKPTALKMLRGNPGKERLNPDEPHPEPADPSIDTPPPELATDAQAAAEWARIVPILRRCGMITQTERPALVALCQQWSLYLTATREIGDRGMVIDIDTPAGLAVNPYLGIADRALGHCHRLWAELGFTPSGRARLTKLQPTPEAAAPSKWAGHLK